MTQEQLTKEVFWLEEGSLTEQSGTYKEFLSQFIEETTSPKGVAPRDFIEEIEQEEFEDLFDVFLDDDENLAETTVFLWDVATNVSVADIIKEYGSIYTISTWGYGGNNYKRGERFFATEEGAENEYYEYVEIKWQENYCQTYFETEEEMIAEKERIDAEELGVDVEVLRSIQSKQKKIEEIKLRRYQLQRELIEKEAETYAQFINKIEEETYKDTCKRLSKALDKRISGAVFHRAVKLIRKN